MRRQRNSGILTLNQLRLIVEDYQRAFPGWTILEGALLARESCPVLQYIGFERLLGGAYRIQCGAYYTCVPDRDGGLPPQYLSVRQSIYPRAHHSLREKVVEAIYHEVTPRVDRPLESREVLAMHEGMQPLGSPDAHSLACFNAYLGNDDRALYWCNKFPELVEQIGMGWQECDLRRGEFLAVLRQWINVGQAKVHLERIVYDERHRWGMS